MNILIFLNKRLYNLPSFKRFSQNTSFFFLKQLAVSVIKVFRSIQVLLYVYQWVSFTIFQIKTNYRTGQQNIYYFTPKTLHTSFFSWKISPLHRRVSRKHSLFTTFSLVFRMSQVFTITNKYQFRNQSAKNLYFHPRDFTYLLYICQYTCIQDPV